MIRTRSNSIQSQMPRSAAGSECASTFSRIAARPRVGDPTTPKPARAAFPGNAGGGAPIAVAPRTARAVPMRSSEGSQPASAAQALAAAEVAATAEARAAAAVDAEASAFLRRLETMDLAAEADNNRPEEVGVLAESVGCIARLIAANRVLTASVMRLVGTPPQAPAVDESISSRQQPHLPHSPRAPALVREEAQTKREADGAQLDAAASLAASNTFLLSRIEELEGAIALANAENARLRSRQAAMDIAAGKQSEDGKQLQLVCGNAIHGLAVALANLHCS